MFGWENYTAPDSLVMQTCQTWLCEFSHSAVQTMDRTVHSRSDSKNLLVIFFLNGIKIAWGLDFLIFDENKVFSLKSYASATRNVWNFWINLKVLTSPISLNSKRLLNKIQILNYSRLFVPELQPNEAHATCHCFLDLIYGLAHIRNTKHSPQSLLFSGSALLSIHFTSSSQPKPVNQLTEKVNRRTVSTHHLLINIPGLWERDENPFCSSETMPTLKTFPIELNRSCGKWCFYRPAAILFWFFGWKTISYPAANPKM